MPRTTLRNRLSGVVVLAVGLFFAAGGVWLLSMGYRLYSTQRDRLAHAEHATGTVVDFEKMVGYDRRLHRQATTFSPVFTFTDRTGTLRRVTSRVGSTDKPAWQIGQTMPVLYHRDRPAEADFDTFFASWGGVLITGVIGTAFFGVGTLAAGIGARRLLWPGNGSDASATGTDSGAPRDP